MAKADNVIINLIDDEAFLETCATGPVGLYFLEGPEQTKGRLGTNPSLSIDRAIAHLREHYPTGDMFAETFGPYGWSKARKKGAVTLSRAYVAEVLKPLERHYRRTCTVKSFRVSVRLIVMAASYSFGLAMQGRRHKFASPGGAGPRSPDRPANDGQA